MRIMRVLLLLSLTFPLLALENAKVLPKGVRSLNIKAVQVDLTEKYDAEGQLWGLAQPLHKKITFADLLKSKRGLDETKLRALLQENEIDAEQELGTLTADMKGRMRVYAPVLAFGLTERVTLAVAVPYYSARTEVAVGYQANDANAQHFINLLASPRYNQPKSAKEAYAGFSDGVAALNGKLIAYDYQRLGTWNEHGLGDTTFAVKTKILGSSSSMLHLANLSGVVAPTGRVDNPDILTDVPFGDGTWDMFTGLYCDQELGLGLMLNQFAKFTYQTESRRVVRLKTVAEGVAVPNRSVRYKLGNVVDAGASLQWAHDIGLEMGLGYEYKRKSPDNYYVEEAVAKALEADTLQQSNSLELKLGYSTVPAFKRKSFPVPFSVSLQYKRMIDSPLLTTNQNVPATELLTLDMNLYF